MLSNPHKQVEVKRVFYSDFGIRYMITFRSLLAQQVSSDSTTYLDENKAKELLKQLKEAMEK